MDRMPFFELEELLDSLKMLNEKEEEERKKQEKSDKNGMPSISNYTRQVQSMSNLAQSNNMPTPKMPNFKI